MPASRGGTRQQHPQPPPTAQSAPPPTANPFEWARPPTGVDLHSAQPGFNEPSGRAQALRLASLLAAEVGAQPGPGLPPALTPRAAAALSLAPAPGSDRPSAAALVASHQELLALDETDVVPHINSLDRASSELIKQVGGHCAEQAILIEYFRRHHLAAVGTARALLLRLQHTVGMYEELREAMDGSLLQKFQDSLGDAFAALRVEDPLGLAAGSSGGDENRDPAKPPAPAAKPASLRPEYWDPRASGARSTPAAAELA